MSKANEIFQGWKNVVIKKEHVERIAKARLNICNTCEHHSKFHDTPLRPDDHCTHCSCTLKAKTRSLESECPIGKWPKIESNGKQEEIYDKKSSNSKDSEASE